MLAEQYRHVRMEAFKARKELDTILLKMRYAFGPERESIEQVLAAQEERFELLERINEPTREELNRVTMERR